MPFEDSELTLRYAPGVGVLLENFPMEIEMKYIFAAAAILLTTTAMASELEKVGSKFQDSLACQSLESLTIAQTIKGITAPPDCMMLPKGWVGVKLTARYGEGHNAVYVALPPTFRKMWVAGDKAFKVYDDE
jgi:hypothetical protein